jgi:hypothetical protein
MDDEQIAHTESAFREVNEAIAKKAYRFDPSAVDFVCECADPHCTHRVVADLQEYEEVRTEATHFLLAPGHDEPQVEKVVDRGSRHVVVEKFGTTVERIVRRLNPRARPA